MAGVKLDALPLTLDPADVTAALPSFEAVLAGRRAVLPVARDDTGRRLSEIMTAGDGGPGEEPGTLVACTSGSTGEPKGARLRAANLTASARATASHLAERFGAGEGPWLLALPPHHIAGVQVILRSLHAGHAPAVLGASQDFVASTRRLRRAHPGEDLYTSLVPTQLQRLVDSGDGTAALREYAAVLVGGAATDPELVVRSRRAGVRTVLTYGSSETAGGVVYDGRALPGSSATIDEDSGRILLSGPTVADGYRNVSGPRERDAFPTAGVFRTSDLGRITDGVLTVVGRADGAINSGGMKVLPEEIEAALGTLGVTGCVVGVPDPEWGESAIALVESPVADPTADIRRRMRDAGLAAHLAPRRAFGTTTLPTTGPGKVDRRAVRAELETRLRS